MPFDTGEPGDETPGWKGQYEAELRTVREGLRLLDSLAEKIATTSLASPGEGH